MPYGQTIKILTYNQNMLGGVLLKYMKKICDRRFYYPNIQFYEVTIIHKNLDRHICFMQKNLGADNIT